MDHDLIGAFELTASAAIVIAALASAFGHDAASRIRAAAWLSAWFVLVVILAATRALYYERFWCKLEKTGAQPYRPG